MVEYRSGKCCASHTLMVAAQRLASFALRILWPRLKSTSPYSVRRLPIEKLLVTAPVTLGVCVPTKTAWACAHGTGAPPDGPATHRMALIAWVAGSRVALAIRLVQKP